VYRHRTRLNKGDVTIKQLVKNYSFDKAAKTVTFTDFVAIRLDRVLLVTDVTNNTVIYQFNSSALGGTANTNVLSLTFNTNTSAFNNTDSLQVFYDAASGDPTYDTVAVQGVSGGTAVAVTASAPTTPWVVIHNIASGDATHTDVELKAAPGASLRLYVTDIIITNDSTAALVVFFEEDTASAKTAKTGSLKIPTSGGIVCNFRTPIVLTADKNLGFTNTGQSNACIEVHGYTAA
jgi:hypothetical protein